MLEENKIVFSLNIFYFSICLSSNKLYWIEDQLADVSTRFYTSASWRWRVEPSATWLDTIKIVCLQLVASKIKFHIRILLRKANWNFVVSPIKPKPRYIAISNKWRYNDQEKKIISQRGLLDWLLPIWTLPSVCEIHNKMQVVYKKLTCHTRKLLWKFTISRI